jgi:hypothetical protein
VKDTAIEGRVGPSVYRDAERTRDPDDRLPLNPDIILRCALAALMARIAYSTRLDQQ